jgi:hypothetical protein
VVRVDSTRATAALSFVEQAAKATGSEAGALQAQIALTTARRKALGSTAFERAFAEGRRQTLEQAIGELAGR